MKDTVEVFYDECKDPTYKEPIQLDTEFWFMWIEAHNSFRFVCSHGNISVIKDNKGYWTASKKVDGKLRRKRLGVSQGITYQRLTEACKLLCVNGFWKDYLQSQDSQKPQSENGYKEAHEHLQERLESLKNQYQQSLYTIQELRNENAGLKQKIDEVSQNSCDTDSGESLQTLINDYKSKAKDTRNWVEAKRLIQDIELLLC